jgi:membrane-associated protein
MQRRTYTIYNLLGALLWAVGLTLLGYALGDAIGDNIDTYIIPLVVVVVAVSLLPIVLEHRRSRRASAKATPDQEVQELQELLDSDD